MHINKIDSLYKLQNPIAAQNIQTQQQPDQPQISYHAGLRSKFNDHLVSFGARVDKGLERFYDANKDRMPSPMRRYVDSLEDKTRLTPLQAQRRAFINLENAQNVKDIKRFFPDEPIFEGLIEPENSPATRGIINSVKENKELLEMYDSGVLKDKENLTVYLVKKVFLEAKTIDEINKDLENDLDEEFKADFKHKNPDSKYVYSSTLKALGIKLPDFEYQQSLRFTRDGYSDTVGDKISQGQRAFWDSLDEKERTARAKKSVEKIENWWASLSMRQKLDMIASDENILEMLKAFNKTQRAEQKEQKEQSSNAAGAFDHGETKQRKHTKIHSDKLSRDDLFKKWAANKLKIFEESLSEADKDSLHIKRMHRLVNRWQEMSAQERTDYISKMKAGSEPLRFTMIDAWNHSMDLIKDLSAHLKANQIYKPADMLYSSQEFSQFQSQVMTEFWQNNPDYAAELGNNIIRSQEKINDAISHGTFEELKKQIMRDKNQRVKEMEQFKSGLKTDAQNNNPEKERPEYIKSFIKEYMRVMSHRLHNIPDAYMAEYFDSIETLPKEYIISWTKNLKGETLTLKDEDNLLKLQNSESEGVLFEANRALEAAAAAVLYDATGNPEVYTLSFSDVKTALYKLEIGQNPIEFHSMRLGKDFSLPVKSRSKINKNNIASLYKAFREPLSEYELYDIMHYYFKTDADPADEKTQQDYNKLKEYIKKYSASARIIFSDRTSFSPEVKDAFYRKFIANTAPEILKGSIKPLITSKSDFRKEQISSQAKFQLSKRFGFIPADVMDYYFREMALKFRMGGSSVSAQKYLDECCQKRKDVKSSARMAIMPKKDLTPESKLHLLAFEQAMADVLYDATGNEAVYSMEFETLCDNIELFSMAKKFPTEERTYSPTGKGEIISICARKKLNLIPLKSLYKQYLDEIIEWVNEDVKNNGSADYEDLLYILNPEENNPQRDLQVAKRMSGYGYDVDKITIYPNNFE